METNADCQVVSLDEGNWREKGNRDWREDESLGPKVTMGGRLVDGWPGWMLGWSGGWSEADVSPKVLRGRKMSA